MTINLPQIIEDAKRAERNRIEKIVLEVEQELIKFLNPLGEAQAKAAAFTMRKIIIERIYK